MILMKRFYLITTLLLLWVCSHGQRGPITFEIMENDSVLPVEPFMTVAYNPLNDTIDYRGRRIAKETIMGRERSYDSLGRLVKEIERWDDTVVRSLQTWKFTPTRTIYSLTTYRECCGYSGYQSVFANGESVTPVNHKKEQHRLSITRLDNGKWKTYYTAKYDPSGKLVSQYEDTYVMPNGYNISGVLRTTYFYDTVGRCTRYVTVNDSGLIVSAFRCVYNVKGLIEIWDNSKCAVGYKTYDSCTYDDSGNMTYMYHQSGLEQPKEYLFEYDKYGKVIRFVEKINGGEIMTEHIYVRENGLLLEAITKQYQFGTISTTTYRRRYEFRK